MKAWWSHLYNDENKEWLEKLFTHQPPGNDTEIYFVAVPDEIAWALSFGPCKLLVCPFTTPPAPISRIKIIHLQGHPMLNTITPTVELTWQLILRLVRPIEAARESILEGKWDRFPFAAEQMLSRMNLLVIGRGRIGSRVECIGLAFGMSVVAHNMREHPKDYIEQFEKADIISLHTPPLDYSYLGEIEFRYMKKGIYIVNTAQGNAVDASELIRGLESGKVAGAALDVIDTGRDYDQLRSYAKTHDNLILTPHIGGSTKDAWHETQKMAIEKALEYLGMMPGQYGKGIN